MGNSCGRFVWYELATTDIEAAKAFYSGVVGWGSRHTPMAGSVYRLFTARETPVAGLMELPAEAKRTGALSQWIGYVAVDDVDAAAGRVKELGGTLHIPPTDLSGVSRFSIIADPQMATLAIVKGREQGRVVPAKPGALGQVSWHELLTADLEEAFAFYSELFGWQKAIAHTGSMGTYQQFSTGTEAIGGMFARPEMSPMSFWLYYFSVTDIELAAKRAEAHGGRIFYGPVAVPGGARIVHCMDPQGALFALIDWRVQVVIGCYAPRASAGGPG
jgi:uncharacterized protein